MSHTGGLAAPNLELRGDRPFFCAVKVMNEIHRAYAAGLWIAAA